MKQKNWDKSNQDKEMKGFDISGFTEGVKEIRVDSNADLKAVVFKPIIHKGIATHELEEIPAKYDYQEKIWPMPPENNKE